MPSLAIVLLLPCLLPASSALAATLVVDPDGHGDHATIQAAIDAASDADVIEVWPGTYTENLLIEKGLEIRGAGAGLTIVAGRFLDSVVSTDAAGAEVVLADLTVTDGMADDGGGVYCADTVLTLERVELIGNQASGSGGGACVEDGCALSVRDCDISMNLASSGGGVGDSGAGVGFVIEGSRFAGNMARGDGAGLYLYDEDGTLRANVFSGNQAPIKTGVSGRQLIHRRVGLAVVPPPS